MGQMKEQLGNATIDPNIIKRQIAIVGSMTKAERARPELLKASRKKRVAAGSGTSVQEVNKLIKNYDDISDVMKRMNRLGMKGLMRHGMQGLMPGRSGAPKF
jgi:signal recognition particle subunit SRP54